MKSNFEFLRERWPELADAGSQAEAFSHVDFDKCFECLEKMKQTFESVISAYRSMGIQIRVELIGERPCGNIDPNKEQILADRIERSVREIMHLEPVYCSGSTDANYPLSKGIPAICIGSVRGNRCHTREEFLYLEDLVPAVRFLLDVLQYYYCS